MSAPVCGWQYQLAYEREKLSELQRQVAAQEERFSSVQQQFDKLSNNVDTPGWNCDYVILSQLFFQLSRIELDSSVTLMRRCSIIGM